MGSIFIGIDIGTTKICAVALRGTSGKLVATSSALNASGIKQKGVFFEQNPEKIIQITFKVLKSLLASKKIAKKEIKGVGITGQMHGVVLLDKNLKPITNLVTWQDQRCNVLHPGKKHSYIEEMAKIIGPAAIRSSGCTLSTGYMGATLFWYRINNRLPKNSKASFISDYLAARLTGGKKIYTDPTNAGGSGVFNAKKRKWDKKAISKLKITGVVLPELRSSGEVIGKISAATERLTGLPCGVPVSCSIGDNQASILGGLYGLNRKTVLVNIGTSGQLSMLSSKFVRVPGIDTRCYLDGQYALVGASLCGGYSYRILAEFFSRVIRVFSGKQPSGQLYEKMNHAAAKGDLLGLSCDTQFLGTRLDPKKRGVLKGLSAGNLTPENLSLSVLKGMTEELYSFYEAILKSGLQKPLLILATGNAVKKNKLLQSIISKRFNLPLYLTKFDEEACYGAAMIAKIGTGEKEDNCSTLPVCK